MNKNYIFAVLCVFALTSCENKLTQEHLNGRWVTDSIAVYKGGKRQIYFPNHGDDNISQSLLCNPFIFEFNKENQLTTYQLSDEEQPLSKYRLDEFYIHLDENNDEIQDSIPYTYYENGNLKLDFENEDGKLNYFISKRDIVITKENDKITQEVFIDRMENARRDFDEFENFCRGYSKMLNLNSSLTSNEQNDLYNNGVLTSAYMLAVDAEKIELAIEIAKNILAKPNEQFYSIEFSTNDYYGGSKARFWLIGYSHPQIEYDQLERKMKQDISAYDKAYLNKDFAMKWYDYEWSKIESSAGMSYGEKGVENIYFDDELDSEIKLKLLIELSKKTEGPARGNAFYCLYLIRKDSDYYREDAISYLDKAKQAYKKSNDNHHVREMLEIIEEKQMNPYTPSNKPTQLQINSN